MAARLEVLSGKGKGKVFDLPAAGEVDIGNRKAAKISIRDPWISYNHAKIVGEDGRLFIEDLGSSNGTWVDGAKIKRHELREGLLLYFGKTKVRVIGADAPAGAPAGGGDERAWYDKALEGGAAGDAARAGPRVRKLEAELAEERRMCEALEKFLDLPTGSSVGDAARAGALEQQVRELQAKLEAASASGQGAAEAAQALEEERARAEKARREHMSKLVELEGKVQQAEAKAVDLESRLKQKTEQASKDVERAREKVQAELDELRSALEEARKSNAELASGGDDALAAERERGDRLEKELEEWRDKARATEERVVELERALEEAKQAAEAAAAAPSGPSEDVETIKSQLWAAVQEAAKWKEEAARAGDEAAQFKEEHAKVVAEIDEISMEQIEVEDELKRTIAALEERVRQLEGGATV